MSIHALRIEAQVPSHLPNVPRLDLRIPTPPMRPSRESRVLAATVANAVVVKLGSEGVSRRTVVQHRPDCFESKRDTSSRGESVL